MRSLFIIFILFVLTSCAQKPEEKTAEAIDVALSHLSSGECDAALEVLQDASDLANPIYVQVLASAYSCKANYDEVEFISNDLSGLSTGTPAAIMKSIASMSLSPETAADSDNYVAIRTGINTILGATTTVTHDARVTKFGARKAGDLSVQALMLNVVNLGKFLNFYGNADADGDKGQGTNTNSCFINYTDPRAQTVITSGVGGVCNSNTDGHPDLSFAAANLSNAKRRLCEGLMLVTNVLDILDNLDLSGSSELAKLEDISAQVSTFKTAAVAAGLGTLINMTSQSQCETAMNTASNLNDMEYLYSLVFETGLQ
ncbi:hypothetical protein [Peredibacter starrii]|uniref:Lipoprotein n=1 Tax=Peredibacter starrii TaxID=28202 RepID=A0AAX4HMP1_9BACT|nr:hypothetical protein [Peredibacter starrii]WPU64398.1 hypothetical protein SOO65_17025 [Peredibacter starrii]